jgi:hypothetical protein
LLTVSGARCDGEESGNEVTLVERKQNRRADDDDEEANGGQYVVRIAHGDSRVHDVFSAAIIGITAINDCQRLQSEMRLAWLAIAAFATRCCHELLTLRWQEPLPRMGFNITVERGPAKGCGDPVMKKTYEGSCHCGKVRFEVDVDPDGGMRRCHCWICARHRSWETLIKAADFRLLTSEAELSGYPFGTQGGRHLFCRNCGVASFRRGYAEALGGEYVSITSACLHDRNEHKADEADVDNVGRDDPQGYPSPCWQKRRPGTCETIA